MEEDPLAFFLHFCYKRVREEELGQPSEYDLIRLPQHTVLYDQHFPKQWLYYEGVRLYRKTGKDISDTSQIYRAFVEGTNEEDPNEVVAIFVCYTRDVQGTALKSKEGWCDDDASVSKAAISIMTTIAQSDFADEAFKVAFFTRSLLKLFLQERARRTEKGVLMKFIPPRSKRVESVKVHWTPHVSTAVHRRNLHVPHDRREGGIYARHMAFKNLLHHVEQHNAAPALSETVISICNRLVRDLEAHSEKVKVQEATFFFQPLSKAGDVCFLFCNHCVVMHKKPQQGPVVGLRPRKQSVRQAIRACQKDVLFPATCCSKSRARPATAAEEIEMFRSFRHASVAEKFDFFKTHIIPRYAEAMRCSSSFAESSTVTDREKYLVQRFTQLSREVSMQQTRNNAKVTIGTKHGGGMLDGQPRTIAQLVCNLVSKSSMELDDSPVIATLVETVVNSSRAAVVAGLAIFEICVVTCFREGRALVGEPSTLQDVQTYRARALYVATQRERSKRALDYDLSPNSNLVMTFSRTPNHAPAMRDRGRNIQSKYDQQLKTAPNSTRMPGRALAKRQHLHPDEGTVNSLQARTLHRAREAVEVHRQKLREAVTKSNEGF